MKAKKTKFNYRKGNLHTGNSPYVKKADLDAYFLRKIVEYFAGNNNISAGGNIGIAGDISGNKVQGNITGSNTVTNNITLPVNGSIVIKIGQTGSCEIVYI